MPGTRTVKPAAPDARDAPGEQRRAASDHATFQAAAREMPVWGRIQDALEFGPGFRRAEFGPAHWAPAAAPPTTFKVTTLVRVSRPVTGHRPASVKTLAATVNWRSNMRMIIGHLGDSPGRPPAALSRHGVRISVGNGHWHPVMPGRLRVREL